MRSSGLVIFVIAGICCGCSLSSDSSPAPVSMDAAGVEARAASLFERRDFDGLDALAADCAAANAVTDDGRWLLERFHGALCRATRAWVSALPTGPSAPPDDPVIAWSEVRKPPTPALSVLCFAMEADTWLPPRGRATRREPPANRDEVIGRVRLHLAEVVGRALPDALRQIPGDPEVAAALIRYAGLAGRADVLQELFDAGRASCPGYVPLYQARMFAVVADSRVGPRDLRNQADELCRDLPKPDADAMYALVAAEAQEHMEPRTYLADTGFATERIEAGLRTLLERHPASSYVRSLAALMAMVHGLKPLAASILGRPDFAPHPEVLTPDAVATARAWATGPDGAAPPLLFEPAPKPASRPAKTVPKDPYASPPAPKPLRPLAAGVVVPPKPTDPRGAFHYEMYVGDYLRYGDHRPQWDQEAVNFLAGYAAMLAGHDFRAATRESLEKRALALQTVKGCGDALVLDAGACLFGLSRIDRDPDLHYRLQDATVCFLSQNYPPSVAFASFLRKVAFEADRSGGPSSQLEKTAGPVLQKALEFYPLFVADPHVASETALVNTAGALMACLSAFGRNEAEAYELVTSTIRTARPDCAALFAIAGERDVELAWAARGSDVGSKVGTAAAARFQKHLQGAAANLERAYDLAPTMWAPPTAMIKVCMGLGRPRPEMERWFTRAMKAYPQNFEAASAKLTYLLPRWHGSEKEVLDFARKSLALAEKGRLSPDFAGLLPYAHLQLFAGPLYRRNPSYWAKPDIWPEIDRAQRLATSVPSGRLTADLSRHILVAYFCRQWQRCLDFESRIVDAPVDEEWFGRCGLMASVVLDQARQMVKATSGR